METAEKDLKYVQSLQNKKPEGRHWRRCGVFTVNFEHIWQFFVVLLLLTFNR